MVISPLTLNLDTVHLSDSQFYQLCQNNRELKFERTASGELIIMSPVVGESGNREADLIADLVIWNRQTQLGYTFSSSTIFKLPNGGDRSPDAAWIRREGYRALTPSQRRKFPPIAPDFVIELSSATDDLEMLHSKMREYLDAGVQLGWLINPQQQQVEIYRQGRDVELLALGAELSGEDILPGFTLIPLTQESSINSHLASDRPSTTTRLFSFSRFLAEPGNAFLEALPRFRLRWIACFRRRSSAEPPNQHSWEDPRNEGNRSLVVVLGALRKKVLS